MLFPSTSDSCLLSFENETRQLSEIFFAGVRITGHHDGIALGQVFEPRVGLHDCLGIAEILDKALLLPSVLKGIKRRSRTLPLPVLAVTLGAAEVDVKGLRAPGFRRGCAARRDDENGGRHSEARSLRRSVHGSPFSSVENSVSDQVIHFGGADEVVVGDPADGVGAVAQGAGVVTHNHLRVMVLTV